MTEQTEAKAIKISAITREFKIRAESAEARLVSLAAELDVALMQIDALVGELEQLRPEPKLKNVKEG